MYVVVLFFFLLLSQRISCLDFVTAGTSVLLQEYALDADMTRFGLLITMPVIFCVSLVRCSYFLLLLLLKISRVVLLPTTDREPFTNVRVQTPHSRLLLPIANNLRSLFLV